jgi:hypothetical protein
MPSAVLGLENATRQERRDLRVDFFRGVALLFIFIDHIPGNALAWFTLHSFGFADAAEIFVGLAGYAAYLAYAKSLQQGLSIGVAGVGRRIRDLYVAHILVLCICVSGLAIASGAFQNPVYFEHVNLTPFNHDPSGAIWRALVLLYQPGYLNILPLYMAQLAWVPVVFWLMRTHVAWALVASVGLWCIGGFLGWNFSSYPIPRGWEFNPLAWQLLFTLGFIAASRVRSDLAHAAARPMALPGIDALGGELRPSLSTRLLLWHGSLHDGVYRTDRGRARAGSDDLGECGGLCSVRVDRMDAGSRETASRCRPGPTPRVVRSVLDATAVGRIRVGNRLPFHRA